MSTEDSELVRNLVRKHTSPYQVNDKIVIKFMDSLRSKKKSEQSFESAGRLKKGNLRQYSGNF